MSNATEQVTHIWPRLPLRLELPTHRTRTFVTASGTCSIYKMQHMSKSDATMTTSVDTFLVQDGAERRRAVYTPSAVALCTHGAERISTAFKSLASNEKAWWHRDGWIASVLACRWVQIEQRARDVARTGRRAEARLLKYGLRTRWSGSTGENISRP